MPRKWTEHSNPGERLLGLYSLLLFRARAYSLTHLSEIFGCSKQTILRHLEQIQIRQEINLDTWTEKGQKWVKVKRPSTTANVTIAPESLEYLSMCRDIVAHLLPDVVRQELEQTVALASYTLSAGQNESNSDTRMAASMTKGAIDYSPFQGTISGIFEAIRNRSWLKVRYRSATNQKTTSITVVPLRIVAYREGLYLQCKALDDGEQIDRLLPVQRIKKAEALDETFPAKMLKNVSTPESFGLMTGDEFTVKARVSAYAATYVQERIWSTGQILDKLEDGELEITFTSTSRPEILAWVLSFGGEVELLEPNDMRKEVKARLRKMLKAY